MTQRSHLPLPSPQRSLAQAAEFVHQAWVSLRQALAHLESSTCQAHLPVPRLNGPRFAASTAPQAEVLHAAIWLDMTETLQVILMYL